MSDKTLITNFNKVVRGKLTVTTFPFDRENHGSILSVNLAGYGYSQFILELEQLSLSAMVPIPDGPDAGSIGLRYQFRTTSRGKRYQGIYEFGLTVGPEVLQGTGYDLLIRIMQVINASVDPSHHANIMKSLVDNQDNINLETEAVQIIEQETRYTGIFNILAAYGLGGLILRLERLDSDPIGHYRVYLDKNLSK